MGPDASEADQAALDDLQSSFPLPPGDAFPERTGETYSTSVEGLASSLAFDAACDWYRHLFEAIDAQDAGEQTQAEDALTVISGRPEATDVISDAVEEIVAASQAGDAEPARQYHSANCSAS